jgi:hypothetical protein
MCARGLLWWSREGGGHAIHLRGVKSTQLIRRHEPVLTAPLGQQWARLTTHPTLGHCCTRSSSLEHAALKGAHLLPAPARAVLPCMCVCVPMLVALAVFPHHGAA